MTQHTHTQDCGCPDRTFEEMAKEAYQRVARHGYTFTGVHDPDGEHPPFFYSVGAHTIGLPDLLLIGHIPPHYAVELLSETFEAWRVTGVTLEPTGNRFGRMAADGTPTGDTSPHKFRYVDPLAAMENYARGVETFYPIGIRDTPMAEREIIQLIWPDPQGHYPDEPEYSTDPRYAQELLPARATH